MQQPGKVPERLAKSGITAVQDALVVPQTVLYYEKLRKSGLMTFRANLMQLYNQEAFRTDRWRRRPRAIAGVIRRGTGVIAGLSIVCACPMRYALARRDAMIARLEYDR